MRLPHKVCIQAGIYAKVAMSRPAGLLSSGLCECAQSASRLMEVLMQGQRRMELTLW